MVWMDPNLMEFLSPLRELDRVCSRADDFLGELFGAVPSAVSGPRTNVFAGEDEYLFRMEVPGFGPADVSVEALGRKLDVQGAIKSADESEKSARSFERSFELPFRIATENVTARLENGVLELRVPRAEDDKPKRITIVND